MDNQNSVYAPHPNPNTRIKLNVGGKLFETTVSTLQSGGPESLLSVLSSRPTDEPVFIDRDPEIFSVLLSLLRSNRLPSTSLRFSKQDLVDEAIYYGIDSCLRSAMSPPPLSGIDASLVATVCPSSDPVPSTFTASKHDGSLWIAHGGQISSYDWNLAHSGTIRTHIDDITSICRVWDDVADVAAIGSESSAGLHFYDLHSGKYIESTQWTDSADPRIYKAKVAAVAASSTHVFASFDCPHRENCILTIDKSTLQISSEIARQLGSSTKNTVPRKLTWLPETNLLLGTAVQCGAFGYSGYIRIWDPRSGSIIWETNEPGVGRSSRFGDSFADVDADVESLTLFKICSKSGDLAMADLRNLKTDDPWVYMNDLNPSMRATGHGEGFTIHCYKGQVFVGRGGVMEVWSRTKESEKEKDKDNSMLYRRNFVDKVKDAERGIIRKIEGGGDRLFVNREDAEGVEVWESSSLSGAISSVL